MSSNPEFNMTNLEQRVQFLLYDNAQFQKALDAALVTSTARASEIMQLRHKLAMVSDNKDLKQVEQLSNDLVTMDQQIRELLELRAKDTTKIATLESSVAELENFLTKANAAILLESQNSRKKDSNIEYLQQQLCMVRAALPNEDLQTQNTKLTASLQESRESTAREKIHLAEATKKIGVLESQMATLKKNHAEKPICELRSKLYGISTPTSCSCSEEIKNLKAVHHEMTRNLLMDVHDKQCIIQNLTETIRELNKELDDNEEHMAQMEKAQETTRIQNDNNLLCIMGDLDSLNAAMTRKIERIQKSVDAMTSQVGGDSN